MVAVKGSVPATNPTIVTLSGTVSRGNGIIVDGAGNVYYTQAGDGIHTSATVQLTASTGTKVFAQTNLVAVGNGPLAGFTTAGAPHTLLATGTLPTGLAFDGIGDLYYVDNSSGQLIERTPSGTLTTIATLVSPASLAIDGAGDLFVADGLNGRIFEIAAVAGKIPTNPTLRTLGATPRPYAMAMDRSGNLFYSDTNASTIPELQAVNGIIPTNATPILIGSNIQYALSLAFDNFGHLYYSDTLGTHYFTQVGGQVSPNATVVTPGVIGGRPIAAVGQTPAVTNNNLALMSGLGACSTVGTRSST